MIEDLPTVSKPAVLSWTVDGPVLTGDQGDSPAPAAVIAPASELPAQPSAPTEQLSPAADRNLLGRTEMASPEPASVAPLYADLNLIDAAPATVLEIAPADDGLGRLSDPSLGRALHDFLGSIPVGATDEFSFAGVGEEAALAEDEVLDPFLDAVDPAWIVEVMHAFLVGGDMPTLDLPDAPEPMVYLPLEGADGLVV